MQPLSHPPKDHESVELVRQLLIGLLGPQPSWRTKRVELVAAVGRVLGKDTNPQHLRALLEVPREMFVRKVDVARSAEDVPLPLDETGMATISAPHAYLLSFGLVGLSTGDHLVELGSGSGYGAALAAYIVGETGTVVTIEIDPTLATRAATLLAKEPNVTVVAHNAVTSTHLWGDAEKIVCTFAVDAIPPPWLLALREGSALVAPVGEGTEQRLVLVKREGGVLVYRDHGAVRYVRNRSAV